MCDLNPQDKAALLAALAEITTLAGQIDTHAASVRQTAYMDHEALAGLLARLRDQAGTWQRWVADKPQEHAGHAGH